MIQKVRGGLLALLLAACTLPPGQQASSETAAAARAQVVALTHVTLIDVEAGERLTDHTVVVEGDRSTANARFFPLFVANGVTGVRDMRGELVLARSLEARDRSRRLG